MKPFLLLVSLAFCACTVKPFATLSDGTKISLGGSIASKSTSEASSAKVTDPKTGKVIELKEMVAGKDETAVPNAYIGYKLSLGLGGQLAHSADVKEQQGTARAANARPSTPTSTTDPITGITTTGSTPPPPAIVPGIGTGKGH